MTYYNSGIRGETSDRLRNRWKSEVNRRLEEAENGRVVFSFGTNDTTIQQGECRVSLLNSVDNFRTILSASLEYYPTLAISPLPLLNSDQNERTSELVDHYAGVVDGIELEYLNRFDELRQGSPWMESLRETDGYHPLSDGYELLAEGSGIAPAGRIG